MQNNSTEVKIMTMAAATGVLPPEVIYCINEKEDTLRKTLKRLTDRGCLDERKIHYLDKGNKRTYSYRVLTPKGLKWLAENAPDTEGLEWLTALPVPLPNFVFGYTEGNDNLHRLLQKITASIMFNRVGIPTYVPAPTGMRKSYGPKTITYDEVVMTAKMRYVMVNNGGMPIYEPIRSNMFFYSNVIKERFTSNRQEASQYKFSRNLGTVILDKGSYQVYHTVPSGLLFSKDGETRARIAVDSFIRTNNIEQPLYHITSSILLCRNAREFERMFTRNYMSVRHWSGKRANTLKAIHGYELFGSLYAVPVNQKGVRLLDNLFNNSIVPYEREKALQKINPGFKKAHPIKPVTFGDKEVQIAVDMDIGLLQKFVHMAKQNPDKGYIVVCYDWQVDYYSRILPDNIEVYVVPDGSLD